MPRIAPIALALVVLTLVWAVVAADRRLVRPMAAAVAALEDQRLPGLVRVRDRRGNAIDAFGPQIRIPVPLRDIPAPVIDAFVAAEDRRFWDHRGIDARGIGRAAWVDLRAGAMVQGGSTITQQVVKQQLVGDAPTWGRKLEEAVGAVLLERRLSKAAILERYLNVVYLGRGAYGVAAAAETYFGLDLAEITPDRAALLASLAPAPSERDPDRDPAAARLRRNRVLSAMVDTGALSAADADRLARRPLGLVGPDQGPPRTGDAYRTQVRRELAAIFGGRVPYDRGLEVRTAYDPEIQAVAEAAVREAILDVAARQRRRAGAPPLAPGEDPGIQGAAMVMDTATGEVLALVGGYDDPLGGLIRAVQSPRQPGSTFKTFVYATALSTGLSPGHLVLDEPVELADGWRPVNHGERYRGAITLREALAASSNVAAVRVARHVGMPAVLDTARRMGISRPLRDDLSVALGSSEVTLEELTTAYATVARGGTVLPPRYVTAITTRDGVDLTPPAPTPVRALAPEVAGALRDMLGRVVRYGTGHAAWRARQERIGKTGTTDRNVDAWFVGSTPRHTIGVWIGRDDAAPLGPGETGQRAALPAWAAIADHLGVPGRDEPVERFPPVADGPEGAVADVHADRP